MVIRIDGSDREELIRRAFQARELFYAPYSGYAVGAALLTAEGKIYSGCNIENAAYGPTNCAERTAFFKAVSEGERHFKAIAIAGGPAGKVPTEYAYPCGVCRQVMSEFCDKDFLVILAKAEADYEVYSLEELLPKSFSL
ncbi:MAG: cytidine deaminase [Lachnospiraceae bacterium]|nr:cytidine deaminase [Lachnospiraceae bacterium]